ncbi:chitosanase [Actinomycetospora sp. NBC_00405]|uniref:chitosanase n=1 Tax=Actinomycetospora sp. NBC_00405 TaxID=2975952 RepID=UPI002E2505DE
MNRRGFLVLAGLAGWAVTSGCGATDAAAGHPERLPGLADPDRRRVAEAVISTFENSTIELPYAAAHRLDDGRGITAGRAGFTSGTHDLLLVVQRYAATAGNDTAVSRYLPALRAIDTKVADGGDGSSTKGLDGFEDAWRTTSQTDPRLNAAQDAVYDDLYFRPGMDRARRTGQTTALGQLVILDTAVQHGLGSPDGLDALIRQTNAKAEGAEPVAWLRTFLQVRRADLENPVDEETTEVWRESIPRVDTLETLLQQQRFDLDAPLAWTFAGGRFSLPA